MTTVIALSDGFYGGARRRAGTTFEVADGAKAKWYAPADSAAHKAQQAKDARAAAKAKISEKRTLSEIAKTPTETAISGGAGDIA